MVDKIYSMSSYLALRYIEKPGVDITEKLRYRHPELPKDEDRILVCTSQDIGAAIETQLNEIRGGIPKLEFFSLVEWIRQFWHPICRAVMRIPSAL